MSKKILILIGSPRNGGNTDLLSDELIRGAKENGCETEKLYIKDKNIKGCLGCGACQRNDGICVQKDDMTEIYVKMMESDVIVFASPVYFYSWTSQIKAVIDRTFSIESKLMNKTFYLISSGAAPEESYMETMIDSFTKYISCFKADGNKVGGYVFGLSANKPGDVKDTEAMIKAYKFGKGEII